MLYNQLDNCCCESSHLGSPHPLPPRARHPPPQLLHDNLTLPADLCTLSPTQLEAFKKLLLGRSVDVFPAVVQPPLSTTSTTSAPSLVAYGGGARAPTPPGDASEQ